MQQVKKLTTLDIEIALMRELNIRQNLIVPRVSWGAGLRYECDLIVLSPSNYAAEIEIKVSKSDIRRDAEKPHGHISEKIARLFFAVPSYLVDFALDHIPERAGLYSVRKYELSDKFDPVLVSKYYRGIRYGYDVTKIRKCRRNGLALVWSDSDRNQLARLGALRILGLMEKLQRQKGLL